MNSLLIAVKSTTKDLVSGAHDRARGGWVKEFAGKADVRFFVADASEPGRRYFIQPEKDEFVLPMGEAETDSAKVRGICKFMLGKMYKHVLILKGPDVNILPGILMSGYQRYDYSGYVPMGRIQVAEKFPYVDPVNGEFYESIPAWVDAQYGIFLSREAASEITDALPTEARYDFFISRVLAPEIFRGQIEAENLNLRIYDGHIQESDGGN